MRSAFRFRLRLVLAGILLVAAAIVLRLYFVQVVHGSEYALKADHQFASGTTLFDRGSIFFTRKDGTLVSAASLETGYLLAIDPQLITNAEATYQTIAPLVATLSESDFLKAASSSSVYVEVAHHLSMDAGNALAALNLKGVQVFLERWRVYPGKTLAAQTLGIVAQTADDTTLRGRSGLEASYEDTLTREGDGLYRNFFAELFSSVGNALANPRQAEEGSVVTTLEPEVETRLASDLAQVNQQYQSKESGGIIMDPKTGTIIAMASVPTYDANDFASAPAEVLADPLVSHVYEFGSIMKSLTMASALDSGAVTATTTYDDTGCVTIDTEPICNYDHKARGVIPMQQILSQSLNVGAAHLSELMGPDTMRSYFLKLGFGEKTGIDLTGETSGLVGNLQSPRQVEYATAAFGQGIAVTPVEMIRALGALANGGAIVTPHVASAIQLDSGITRTIDWSQSTQVFSPLTVETVSRMLTVVVDTALSNGKVAIPSMAVAAKTGTAELVNPAGGYYPDRYFHSFFGYFPSYDPRFIILLYTNDPQGVEYASEDLTATFMDLVHFLIGYYDVPPSRTATSTPQ